MDKVLAQRTRHITVVLENLYQSHNISAVLRTSECYGIQDVHIIENTNDYQINPDIALGSFKWLTLHRHKGDGDNNTEKALKALKRDGYRIVATTLAKKSIPIAEYNITHNKTALLFGTEISGISDTAMKYADDFLHIPMYGFTGSFNVSVSAAIILSRFTDMLRMSDAQWHLQDKEKTQIKTEWLRHSIKKSALIEKKFFETYHKGKI